MLSLQACRAHHAFRSTWFTTRPVLYASLFFCSCWNWVSWSNFCLYSQRLFGVPLSVVVEKEAREDRVPRLIAETCRHLTTYGGGSQSEGLFVQPGALKEILALRSEYERGDDAGPDLASFKATSIATVIKMYLRELPLPLIPINLQNQFLSFANGLSRCSC